MGKPQSYGSKCETGERRRRGRSAGFRASTACRSRPSSRATRFGRCHAVSVFFGRARAARCATSHAKAVPPQNCSSPSSMRRFTYLASLGSYDVTCAGRSSAGKVARLKSGGFPCRFSGCRVCFVVLEQGSMPALVAASGLRTEHEIGVHSYRHQPLEDHMRRQWGGTNPKAPRPIS